MTFAAIVNYVLYALSGFCFGIFASRYSVLATLKLKEACSQGFSLPQLLLPLLFLGISFFIFPLWFITKTNVGGFIYYAVLLYFFSRGYNTYIKKR